MNYFIALVWIGGGIAIFNSGGGFTDAFVWPLMLG